MIEVVNAFALLRGPHALTRQRSIRFPEMLLSSVGGLVRRHRRGEHGRHLMYGLGAFGRGAGEVLERVLSIQHEQRQ